MFDFENENVRQFRPSLPGLNMPCMYKTPASLAIDSHGFIYPCLEYLGNPSKSIGNVIKVSFLSQSKQTCCLMIVCLTIKFVYPVMFFLFVEVDAPRIEKIIKIAQKHIVHI